MGNVNQPIYKYAKNELLRKKQQKVKAEIKRKFLQKRP
jgi:hypothetical protein